MGLIQLFSEEEHDTQFVSNLGKAEFSVDTNGLLHENNLNVSDSLPKLQYVTSSNSNLGFVDLFCECEHAATLVDDLGDVYLTDNNGAFDLYV